MTIEPVEIRNGGNMNSLQSIRDFSFRVIVASILITSFGISAVAQRVEPRQQGRMYGEAGFVGEPINLNVVDTEIRDILNYITEQYGVNFVIDKSVRSAPVTVNVSEVPWNIALDALLQSQDLGAQVNGNILRIADRQTLAMDVEKDLKIMESQLNSQPLMTKYVRLNYARAETAILRGTSTTGMTVGPRMEAGSASFGAPTEFGTSSGAGGTSAATSEGLLPIIQRRLSKRGSIEVDGRSNALIITDVNENVSRIMDLIAILDQPEPQVEIEARIVVATRSFSRDIGVQLAGLVVGARGSGAGGGTLPNASTDINIPTGLPTPSVNNSMFSSIANTAIGLTTGIFGTAQLSALISAGEQKGQAKIIATPRVTTLNLKEAMIESGTKIPITTIQPGAAAGGAVVATTQYVDVPLKLQITPQITDVGTIVLEVLAENSSVASISGGAAPAINNQVMRTQVTVPDGGTTVVGGVLFDDERENQDRTPGLSRIPLLGNLFKRKGVQRNTNEILFFITPRIYRPDYEPATGKAGVVTEGTFVQPVPLGNPPSNSGVRQPAQPQPQPQSAAPVQPATERP
jgi:type IV pilus assembly protein PilQ